MLKIENQKVEGPGKGVRSAEKVFVTVDITAPMYWWNEFAFSGALSGAGTLIEKNVELDEIGDDSFKFTPDHFSTDCLDNELLTCTDFETTQVLMGCVQKALECVFACFLEDGRRADDWGRVMQILPSSFNQKRTLKLSYATLAELHRSYHSSILYEWHEFCDWIKALPKFYKIVMTCYDYNDIPPYEDEVETVYESKEDADKALLQCVDDEVNGLNDGDAEGEFCANFDYQYEPHDAVVEFWEGEPTENDCSFRPVTTYDIVEFSCV